MFIKKFIRSVKSMQMKQIILFIIFSTSWLQYQYGQNDVASSKTKAIKQILIEGGNYAANIVLDQEGKSRCDYNITEGKWYPYEEPWHTGQIIYGLLEAYRITRRAEFLDAAIRAGDWWTSLEIKDHPKLKGMVQAVHGDHAGDVIVFATVSDGTAGLFKLYETTGINKYADVPTSAGKWMLKNMCLLDKGLCYDNVDPQTGEVLTQNSPFHRGKENQTLNDVSRPNTEGSLFMDMFEYTQDNTYKEAFIILCNSVVEKQDDYGLWMDFIPNHKEVGTFHPRFNLWYAESLLEGFDLTGDKKYLEAAKKTVDRYAAAQQKSGAIYYKNFLDGSYEHGSICGSSVSFMGMLMIRLVNYGYAAEDYEERIELCADWLQKNRFSMDHEDPNLQGAFMNIRTRFRKGKHWIVNRDVGTAFGLRFFAAYYDYLLRKS